MQALLIIGISFAIGTGSLQNNKSLKEEDGIRRVVMGHLMKAERDTQHSIYFLSVGRETDPSPSLLEMFTDCPYVVKKESESKRLEGKNSARYGVADRDTGAIGAIVFAESIVRTGRDKASVRAGMYSGGLYSVTYLYTVERRKARWRTTSRRLVSVS